VFGARTRSFSALAGPFADAAALTFQRLSLSKIQKGINSGQMQAQFLQFGMHFSLQRSNSPGTA
jgi:hypothetical protein